MTAASAPSSTFATANSAAPSGDQWKVSVAAALAARHASTVGHHSRDRSRHKAGTSTPLANQISAIPPDSRVSTIAVAARQ